MRAPSSSRAMLAMAMACWVASVAGSNAVGWSAGALRPSIMFTAATPMAAPRHPSRQVRAIAGIGRINSNCSEPGAVIEADTGVACRPTTSMAASAPATAAMDRTVHSSSARRIHSRARGARIRMPVKSPSA
ncbi:hypothetical protein G6F68_019241 [Rhizopus microsporus]|nr:hypothetical protein G6F68_019241 [Rhizopus microsporus]